ncbi:MAG: SDR family NAD(P)-dependent oxidoreductase [Mucilaginibacter polytrichastri]|nr:SDR family NAD(P)-dependent oxidoreductase [Mucilaginibacter polytrichastri]
MEQKKIWLVTGASKGLGLALVSKLLQQGYAVAATSRNAAALEKAVGISSSDTFLPLEVDLSSGPSVADAVRKTQEKFGRIDVVVNNAGYGIGGAIEELNEREVAESFEINVFATIRVIREVLPLMRAQRAGHIINISSIAGFAGGIGWSVYAAAKHAVMGLSDVLAADVKEFGIHVTVVAPGAFRTEFLSAGSLVFAEKSIAEYTAIRASHARYGAMDGTQIGDPEKAAGVFIALSENPQPPVHLFLGSDAFQRAQDKLDLLSEELKTNSAVAHSTDFTH